MKTPPNTVAERLALGSARGLGAANVVAVEALHSPAILRELLTALRSRDSVVTSRAANALKKIQKVEPEKLAGHARVLLQAAAASQDLQTRWNLTVVVGGLPLRGSKKALAVDLLFEALGSGSAFLRTFALTGLTNLAKDDEALRRRVRPGLEKALQDPSAAMRARARKLLKGLEQS